MNIKYLNMLIMQQTGPTQLPYSIVYYCITIADTLICN